MRSPHIRRFGSARNRHGRSFPRAVVASVLVVSGMLGVGASPARAASHVAPAPVVAPTLGEPLSVKQWMEIKAGLDANPKLVKTSSGSGITGTYTYALPDGPKLVLQGAAPAAVKGVSPQFTVTTSCGFLRLCVRLNRGEQLIVMAGSFAALGAAICLVSAGVACVVVAAALAMAAQWLNNRGYVCPNYMLLELAFSPGTIRGCS